MYKPQTMARCHFSVHELDLTVMFTFTNLENIAASVYVSSSKLTFYQGIMTLCQFGRWEQVDTKAE